MSLASSLNKFREYDHRVHQTRQELSELDGSQDPVKCLALIGKLKEHQNKMVEAIEEICVHVAKTQGALAQNHPRLLQKSSSSLLGSSSSSLTSKASSTSLVNSPPGSLGSSASESAAQGCQQITIPPWTPPLLDRHHRWKFPPKAYDSSVFFNPQLYFAIEALDACGVIEGNILLSEDLRPQASALLAMAEELRRVFRNQIESLVAAKHEGHRRNFLTPEIFKTIVKFDAQWSSFEAQYLARSKEPRAPNEADILLQLACFMDDCIARLLKTKLITPEMISDYDPSLMISLPRILILRGIRIQSGLEDWLQSNIFTAIKPKIAHASHLIQKLTAEQYRELEKRLVDPEYEVESDDTATGIALRNLFMQLSDIADTLQRGEYAADMRLVLKAAFKMNIEQRAEHSPRTSSDHSPPLKGPQSQPQVQRQGASPPPSPPIISDTSKPPPRPRLQSRENSDEDRKPIPTQTSSIWSFFSAPPKSKPVKMRPTHLSFTDSTDSKPSTEGSTMCARCSLTFSATQPPVICGRCHLWFCDSCTPFKVPAGAQGLPTAPSSSVPSIRVCKRCYAFEV